VQILVVVAITQARSLWSEVRKGSLGTAIVQGLAGPKSVGKSGKTGCPFRVPSRRKGTGLIIPGHTAASKRQRSKYHGRQGVSLHEFSSRVNLLTTVEESLGRDTGLNAKRLFILNG